MVLPAYGYNTFSSANNQVRIGSTAVTSIGGQVGWTTVSDARFKNNVEQNVPGLEFINKLNPVTYHLSVSEINDHFQVETNESDRIAIAEKEKIVYSGFLAQEVEIASKEIGYDFSGVDAPKNETDIYGLRYAEFVVPIVKAVQELSETNEELQTENSELKSRLDRIESLLNISETTTTEVNNFQKVVLSSTAAVAVLGQNIPNQFNEKTIIQYYVPLSSTSSQIKITTQNGVELKTIDIAGGQGNVEIDATQIYSGNYLYSLIVDGKIVDTKQMVLTK